MRAKAFSPCPQFVQRSKRIKGQLCYQSAAKNRKIVGFDLCNLIWIGKIYWEFNG